MPRKIEVVLLPGKFPSGSCHGPKGTWATLLRRNALESDLEVLPPPWAACWLERHWRFGSDTALENTSILHTDEG